jgi:hypothetical protein
MTSWNEWPTNGDDDGVLFGPPGVADAYGRGWLTLVPGGLAGLAQGHDHGGQVGRQVVGDSVASRPRGSGWTYSRTSINIAAACWPRATVIRPAWVASSITAAR